MKYIQIFLMFILTWLIFFPLYHITLGFMNLLFRYIVDPYDNWKRTREHKRAIQRNK